MIPQVVTNETVTVISPNGVNFSQTDKPQHTYQLQDNLKNYLKAEIKVLVVDGSLITNILSILFAFMGIVILSVSLAGLHPASEQYEQSKLLRPTEQYYCGRPLDNNDCCSTKAILT